MNTPNDSPALKDRSGDYPIRFKGAVPKMIRMLETVAPDFPIPLAFPQYRGLIAVCDRVYPAWVNRNGAVCAIIGDQQLGVKPDEFEVVAWHEVNCCSQCGLPSGGAVMCEPCARDARAEIAAVNAHGHGAPR